MRKGPIAAPFAHARPRRAGPRYFLVVFFVAGFFASFLPASPFT